MASSSILKQPVSSAQDPMDITSINTIRTLAMDAVQKANSGHPGTPMALAPVAYLLWQNYLRFDPDDPVWPNRDRFVLSAGHASMLLYSLLHLTGVKSVNKDYEILGEPAVSLEDIKKFRQLHSKCSGPSGISPHLGRRDDHRPARPGSLQLGGHGDGRALSGHSLQPAGI